jgi:hypothetical protein
MEPVMSRRHRDQEVRERAVKQGMPVELSVPNVGFDT